jgi:hypothetical protein
MPEISKANAPAAAVEASRDPAHAQAEGPAKSPLLEKIRAWRRRLPFFIRVPLALVFFALGILGGFIPIMQGWVFILAGAWLLFPDHSERLVEKIKAKFSKKKKA